MALVVLWVILSNLLAGVKEADLSRAKSANAGMVESLGHGGIVVLPKTQYDAYKFHFRKQRLATTTLFWHKLQHWKPTVANFGDE